jgi:hypothetical protein
MWSRARAGGNPSKFRGVTRTQRILAELEVTLEITMTFRTVELICLSLWSRQTENHPPPFIFLRAAASLSYLRDEGRKEAPALAGMVRPSFG